jgi:hypothetical protein
MISASSAQPPSCRQPRIEELARTAISMTYVSWPHRKIVQCGLDDRKQLSGNHFLARPSHDASNLLILLSLRSWLAALDNFRNWLALGLQPAKAHENRPRVRMAPAGAARSNRASGAVEAEQLFDPERA